MGTLKAQFEGKKYNEVTVLADMGRSGIVIAVGAMDLYFTRRFTENLIPFLVGHSPSRKLIKLLEDAGLDVATCLKMFAMQRPHRRVRAILARHLQMLVTQRVEAIDGLYKCYSIPSLSEAVEKRAKRKTLLRSVSKLVRRRHAIVHSGDLNSHGRLVPLDPVDAGRRMNDVALFVRTADAVLADRFTALRSATAV